MAVDIPRKKGIATELGVSGVAPECRDELVLGSVHAMRSHTLYVMKTIGARCYAQRQAFDNGQLLANN